MKRALVTGGGGFVGKAVVKRLLEYGIEVRVVGRSKYPELEKLGVQCFQGSITNDELIRSATDSVDVVFHVAALAGIWGEWEDYYQTNVLGTEAVIRGCQTNSVPFLVYTSTPSVVFNQEDIVNGDESLGYATEFLCHYAKSKVIAERMILDRATDSLKVTALRPHLIWGPGDPHLFPRLLESGRLKRLKKVGQGQNLVDISYIDNVAQAHILAAVNLATTASANGKPYFISQESPVNLWQWIGEIFERMDIARVDKEVSFSTAYRVGWILEKIHRLANLKGEPRMTRFLAEQLAKSHFFSIENARRDLGYEPIVTTEEGLKRTIQWLKSK